MGLREPGGRQLAPRNRVVPHAGQASLRFETLGTSLGQRAAARPQRGTGLRAAATDDRRGVAESVGGGIVRSSPAARRIGGLGAERKDVLSGCFGLLALMAYARYGAKSVVSSQWSEISRQASEAAATDHGPHRGLPATDHGSRIPVLPPLPLLLRLGSAEQADAGDVALRHVAAGLLALGALQTEQCVAIGDKKIPFFAFAALTSVVTFMVQQHGGALSSSKLPLRSRLGNALISYGGYLGKLFWPTDLAVFYPHPRQWPLGEVLLAGGMLLGLSVLVWVLRRRFPYLLVGWLWFTGTLIPVIGLVQVGGQAMADRYTYLPSLGVLALAVWGAYELTQGWRYPVLALSAAGGAAIVMCLALTRQQLGYWQDSETLFRHALEATENNPIAHNNLGIALGRKANSTRRSANTRKPSA